MTPYICIHGHFYQPPRENPWLEVIEHQDGPFPFHDWNEKITAECYGPNAWSRILDDRGHIVDIVNNYSRISFNFGPTLLAWMEAEAPEVYARVLEADQLSQQRFSGHGSAMAQAYNHLIMPLATRRVKEAQVEWGIRDFQKRFGRDPKGMWLPETAVDAETLEVLASNGIEFTVLAPRQAKSVRSVGGSVWHDVGGSRINSRQAYSCPLPSGRSISLFFYDGVLAQDVAFKGLLGNGSAYAERLLGAFDRDAEGAQLVHVATDGESYGHHHRHGDMALAVALDRIEKSSKARLVNYGEFLELHPPRMEVEIVERSSWSCIHGVERWRSDCGCRDGGGGEDYSLAWREPLRTALDNLAAKLDMVWSDLAPRYFKDPDQARNEYINVILDRSLDHINRFLAEHMKGDHEERTRQITALRMLEMDRQSMLMYTSCGWFFDEISRTEPVQILRYANRAIQLAERETGHKLESEFRSKLEEAVSNHPDFDNAAAVYDQLVAPNRLTLSKVGMHYAVYSLFEEIDKALHICNYVAFSEFYERVEAGTQRLALGRTRVVSKITKSQRHFSFAVVYLGQHQIIGQFESDMDREAFDAVFKELTEAFMESRVADVLSLMQSRFGGTSFSFWNLFRDEQRKVLEQIVEADLKQAENSYKKIFDRNYNIMNVLRSAELQIPQVFARNLEVVINTEIRKSFEGGPLNPRKLEKLALQARKWEVPLAKEHIAFAAGERLLTVVREFAQSEDASQYLQRLNRVFKVLQDLGIQPDLWKIQNAYYFMARELTMPSNGKPSHDLTEELREEVDKLGSFLHVKAMG